MATKQRRAQTKWHKPWMDCPLPERDFVVQLIVWRFALWCAYRHKPVLFLGPTGCGKTELVQRIAEALRKRLYSVNMGATTDSRAALIGTTHFSDSATHFQESRFVKGLQDKAGLILLDEITRASLDAFNIIIPVLDRQAYISLDDDDPPRVVVRDPEVVVMATANVGLEYTGTRQMDRALLDRFLVIELDYPPADDEARLIASRTGVSLEMAGNLVSFARDCRSLWRDDELSSPVSTRMLLEAGEAIADGFDPVDVIEFTVLNFFNADEGAHSERTRVRQLLRRF